MSARTRMPPSGAVVVAVGSWPPGGDDLLWADVAGRPLIAWTLAAFEWTPAIARSVLVVPSERLQAARALARREGWRRTRSVAGGPRWRDAVFTGLAALPPSCAWVVVHDGARPLVTPALIADGIAAARRSGAATAAAPVNETLKQVESGIVVATPPRDRLALLQTPQVFERRRLLALRQSDATPADAPDEATLALAAGIPVATYPSGHGNLKVVSRHDLAVLEAALRGRMETEKRS
jgi:2-C-methyl-D-erythritol 4-phosphate cytidylyltransferase